MYEANVCVCIYVYTYVYVCVCICMYILCHITGVAGLWVDNSYGSVIVVLDVLLHIGFNNDHYSSGIKGSTPFSKKEQQRILCV